MMRNTGVAGAAAITAGLMVVGSGAGASVAWVAERLLSLLSSPPNSWLGLRSWMQGLPPTSTSLVDSD